MGGSDDELCLSLSLGFGVTTQPSFIHRPSNSMINHLRRSSWKDAFQVSGNFLILCSSRFIAVYSVFFFFFFVEFFLLDLWFLKQYRCFRSGFCLFTVFVFRLSIWIVVYCVIILFVQIETSIRGRFLGESMWIGWGRRWMERKRTAFHLRTVRFLVSVERGAREKPLEMRRRPREPRAREGATMKTAAMVTATPRERSSGYRRNSRWFLRRRSKSTTRSIQ